MPKNWNEYIILLSVVIADVNVVSWTWNSLLLKIISAKIFPCIACKKLECEKEVWWLSQFE